MNLQTLVSNVLDLNRFMLYIQGMYLSIFSRSMLLFIIWFNMYD